MPLCLRQVPGVFPGKWYWCTWTQWWSNFKENAASSLKQTVAWCVDAILQIKKAFATLGFYFQEWIAKWAATDAGLAMIILDAVIIIIGAVVLGPIIAGLPFVLKIKSWIASMKLATGALLSKLHLTELHLISEMMEVLWPQYRALVKIFENALSGLSEQLGYGTGMIVGVMSGVRAIIHSSYTILGWDAKAKEVAWFDAANESFKRIRKRFYDYAYEPGKMMDDIIEEIVIPASQTASDAQLELLGEVRKVDDRAHEITNEVQNISDSIDGIVRSLPEDMTRHFLEHWGPIKKDLDKTLEVWRKGMLTTLDGVVEAWQSYADTQSAITDKLAKEANEPMLLLKKSDALDMTDRYLFGEGIGRMIEEADQADLEAQAPAAYDSIEKVEDAVEKALAAIKTMPSLAYEPSGVHLISGGPASDKTDWYVGEF